MPGAVPYGGGEGLEGSGNGSGIQCVARLSHIHNEIVARIYSGGGVSPTILRRDYKDPPKVIVYDNSDVERGLPDDRQGLWGGGGFPIIDGEGLQGPAEGVCRC